MLDLKRLGHLVALADECHFARAAERVHLSQPAFSRSIQAIERELDLLLFDRGPGELKPTPAGQFMIERARRLLFEARCLQRDARLYRETQLGDTAFGAGPFPAATLMPQVIAQLRRAHPGVGLRLETSNWQLLHQRLMDEDIEFFVADTRDLPPDARLEIESLGRQSAHLYARAGHPLAGRRCSLKETRPYGLATTKLPAPVKALLAQLLGLPGAADVVLALECDDVSLLRSLALDSDTVSAISDAAAHADVKARRLVRLDVPQLPQVYAEMGVVTLRQRTPSPMAQRAIETLRKVARSVNRR